MGGGGDCANRTEDENNKMAARHGSLGRICIESLLNRFSGLENRFSTIKLSTGQRKRLALLVSYLEDRPILLFDEWAADQDFGFREFFYYEIIPGLKRRNKTVIVISHDDRYFHLADRLVKLEFGRVVDGVSDLEYALHSA